MNVSEFEYKGHVVCLCAIGDTEVRGDIYKYHDWERIRDGLGPTPFPVYSAKITTQTNRVSVKQTVRDCVNACKSWINDRNELIGAITAEVERELTPE
jgi:hypothetical protein